MERLTPRFSSFSETTLEPLTNRGPSFSERDGFGKGPSCWLAAVEQKSPCPNEDAKIRRTRSLRSEEEGALSDCDHSLEVLCRLVFAWLLRETHPVPMGWTQMSFPAEGELEIFVSLRTTRLTIENCVFFTGVAGPLFSPDLCASGISGLDEEFGISLVLTTSSPKFSLRLPTTGFMSI